MKRLQSALLFFLFCSLALPLAAQEVIFSTDDISVSAPANWQPYFEEEGMKKVLEEDNKSFWQPKSGEGVLEVTSFDVPLDEDAHLGFVDALISQFQSAGGLLTVDGRINGPAYTYGWGGRWKETGQDEANIIIATDKEMIWMKWKADSGIYLEPMSTLSYLMDYVSVRAGSFTETTNLPPVMIEFVSEEEASQTRVTEGDTTGSKDSGGGSLLIPILIGLGLLGLALFLLFGRKKKQ